MMSSAYSASGTPVLVRLEEFSTSVRKAAARASDEAGDRIVAAVVVADDDAFGVAEYVDSDLASARERKLVGGEAASDERPDERLRLLRRQLEPRLVGVHDLFRADPLDERLTEGLQLLRSAPEQVVSVVRRMGMPSRLKSASSR